MPMVLSSHVRRMTCALMIMKYLYGNELHLLYSSSNSLVSVAKDEIPAIACLMKHKIELVDIQICLGLLISAICDIARGCQRSGD